jgi:hypothetical protein
MCHCTMVNFSVLERDSGGDGVYVSGAVDFFVLCIYCCLWGQLWFGFLWESVYCRFDFTICRSGRYLCGHDRPRGSGKSF